MILAAIDKLLVLVIHANRASQIQLPWTPTPPTLSPELRQKLFINCAGASPDRRSPSRGSRPPDAMDTSTARPPVYAIMVPDRPEKLGHEGPLLVFPGS
jgi:hypothetical protein